MYIDLIMHIIHTGVLPIKGVIPFIYAEMGAKWGCYFFIFAYFRAFFLGIDMYTLFL